jgi:hypothetical protein
MQIRVLGFISIFAAGAAHADSTGDALAEIARCAGIGDSSARLRCFDAAALRTNSTLAAHQAGEARDRVEGAEHSSPPQTVTRTEDFGKPPPPPKITRITATVLELARSVRGRAIFVLDNGQVWRQLDGDDTDVQDPQPGKPMKVAIATGLLGRGYNLTIEGRNAFIRVRRLK